jgi:hypothetical protein
VIPFACSALIVGGMIRLAIDQRQQDRCQVTDCADQPEIESGAPAELPPAQARTVIRSAVLSGRAASAVLQRMGAPNWRWGGSAPSAP